MLATTVATLGLNCGDLKAPESSGSCRKPLLMRISWVFDMMLKDGNYQRIFITVESRRNL
jgi:hypothetical protein